MQQPQADNKIEEKHLLNFVVNSLNVELVIGLGENIEVTPEKLYEVFTGRISINHVCKTTDDSPHANTVRGHPTDQFDPDTVEAIRDTLP